MNENKYAEALGRARVLLGKKGKAFSVTDLETVFPELVEDKDEQTRRMLIEHIKKTKRGPNISLDADRYIDWLERQKPKEWSESDERIKTDLVNALAFFLNDGSAVCPAAETSKEQAIAWLEGLKPSNWKPSKLQMEALHEFVWCKEPRKELSSAVISLYHDLERMLTIE